MSAVALQPEPAVSAPQPAPRLLTAADLAALPTELPSGTVRYELHNGQLFIMSPPGYRHGRVGAMIVAQLLIQGEQRGLGEAVDECGIVLWRGPDQVVGADAAFIATRSLPAKLAPEGYLETIPDLVAEVRSKNDTTPEVESKVRDYLTAGVVLVWVADPEARTVTVYRPGAQPTTLTLADTLAADPVIPGFA